MVLMSATLDSHLFARYFGDCPVLTAEGRTFPVTHMFLEVPALLLSRASLHPHFSADLHHDLLFRRRSWRKHPYNFLCGVCCGALLLPKTHVHTVPPPASNAMQLRTCVHAPYVIETPCSLDAAGR